MVNANPGFYCLLLALKLLEFLRVLLWKALLNGSELTAFRLIYDRP
jgi:hypothetical protein